MIGGAPIFESSQLANGLIGKKRVAYLRCFDRPAYSCLTGRDNCACTAVSSLDFIKPPADNFRDSLREIPLPVPLVPEPV